MNKIASTEEEGIFLKFLFLATLLFLLLGIAAKFINGYHRAVLGRTVKFNGGGKLPERIFFLRLLQCLQSSFDFCAVFVFFLTSLALKSTAKTSFFAVVSFCTLFLSILQATFLDSRFARFAHIK
jgi:hypothetical protein